MHDANALTGFTMLNKHILVASGTATVAGVDLRDFIGSVKLMLSTVSPVGDGSTTCTISLLDSADNTTFAATTHATFSPVTATSSFQEVSLDTAKVQRYLQVRHVVTGTTATFTTSVIGVGIKQVEP